TAGPGPSWISNIFMKVVALLTREWRTSITERWPVESTKYCAELAFRNCQNGQTRRWPNTQVIRVTFRVAMTTSCADSVTDSFDSSESMSAQPYNMRLRFPTRKASRWGKNQCAS